MLLVVLTGCNIASKVVVNPNGSGTYSVILTVPSGKAAGAVLSALQNAATKSRVPLQVTPVSLGGESGAKATFTFQSLRDLNAESAVVASSGDGLGVTIHRDSDGLALHRGVGDRVDELPERFRAGIDRRPDQRRRPGLHCEHRGHGAAPGDPGGEQRHHGHALEHDVHLHLEPAGGPHE